MNASTSARIAAWSLKMARSDSKASDADDEDLILKYGSPICLDEKGQLERLNQAYFAGKFAKDTLTVFVPGEDRFYVYDVNSGLWVHQTERWVGAQVHQLMLNFVRDKGIGGVEFSLTRHLLDSIIVQMQGILEDREAFQTPCKLIHVKNGMLDLESGKPVLMHFGPEYGSRRQIQIDFDPHAECERFKDQLLAPAVELDDISLLQRYWGAVLMGGNAAQRILLINGAGGTGKSTLLSVVESVLGFETVGSLRIDQLEKSRFEASMLIGKTLLVAKDVSSRYLEADATHALKSVTGGDRMTAERKYAADTLPLRGTFSVVVVSNAALRLRVDGDATAWERRLLIVPFQGSKPKTAIVGFAEELVQQEGPGILRWMVDGALAHLSELKTSGNYVLTPVQRARIAETLGESDPLSAFFKECVVADPTADIACEELVKEYEAYCARKDWEPIAGRKLLQEIKRLMEQSFRISQSHDVKRRDTHLRGYRKVKVIGTEANAPASDQSQSSP